MKKIYQMLRSIWREWRGKEEPTHGMLQECGKCGTQFYVYKLMTVNLFCPKCREMIRSKEFEHVRT